MHLLIARVPPPRMLTGALIALALALAWAGPSQAQSQSHHGCNLTVAPLMFGRYDVFTSSPARAFTRVLVDCHGDISKVRPRIELSTGSSQTYAQRTQVSGSNVLTYNIYVDSALTQVAGDGTSGTSVLYLDPDPPGPTKSVDLYGAINPRQFVPPGSYFDTVYVTLIF